MSWFIKLQQYLNFRTGLILSSGLALFSCQPNPPTATSLTMQKRDESVTKIAGCQMFPASNMWNTPIDQTPLHPQSDIFIQSLGAEQPFHPDFGTFWRNIPIGIPYNIVTNQQAGVSLTFQYHRESDLAPYPIPKGAKIEGGYESNGDRHILVLNRDQCKLYEVFSAYPNPDGSWRAGSGAIWDLNKNEIRPKGWTSADAAGLPILPGLLRWEDVYEQKKLTHALRVTFRNVGTSFIYPATHSDGRCGAKPRCAPMGLRLRLKKDVDISHFSKDLQIILEGLKKYGLVIADTGGDLYVTGTHDTRWNDQQLSKLKEIQLKDFEAVYTGETHLYRQR